jgi:hypothetical protein
LSALLLPQADAQTCTESSIMTPVPFMGNHGEVFKLSDGSLWEVVGSYEYLYEYYPSVVVCNSVKLLIKGKQIGIRGLVAAPRSAITQPPASRGGRASGGAGPWQLFEETYIEGSVSGTIQQGHIFKTVSGNMYEVTGLTLQLVLELQPKVTVLRNGETYRLIIKGFDEPLITRRLAGRPSSSESTQIAPTGGVIESRIDGEFEGFNADNIYKLRNGQIWQQVSATYRYRYRYSPEVLIYRSGGVFKMRVEDIDGEITVTRLK